MSHASKTAAFDCSDVPLKFIDIETANHLLTSVTRIADSTTDLAERRELLLNVLSRLTGASAGHWSWGRGLANANALFPVAVIDVGFSEQQKTTFIEVGLGPDADREFRQPIMRRMQGHSQWSSLRQDIHEDSDWPATNFRRHLNSFGFDEWAHSVRYNSVGDWATLVLFRNCGDAPFRLADRAVIHVAMASITGLGATESLRGPPDATVGLTARQRTVLLMLLDGQARKQIARQLGITEETVGDHIKQIYKHFEVNSAGELSARFLRGK